MPGPNVLALQLSQTSLTSSDLLLDCELLATVLPPFELHAQWSGGRPLLWWFSPNAFLERSRNLLDWEPAPVTGSPVSVIPDGTQEFYRLRR